MGTVEPIDRPLLPESAEDWFARLSAPDCTARDREAFARWDAASAGHGAAFTEVERIYEESAGLRVDPAIVAATRAALRGPARGRARWVVPASVAASLVLAVIGLAVYRLDLWAPDSVLPAGPSPATALEVPYSTPVGEQLTITLADGSTIFLDTASSVVVRTDDHERSVRLLAGRGQFKVVHDAMHPFTVDVGVGTIRDVGTEFTARREADRVTVTVEQGAVAVAAAPVAGSGARSEQLAPGDQLEFDGTGKLWTTRQVDLKAVSGWTTGELTFDDEPLNQLVAEMNRYMHSQVRIGDAKLAALHISGVFHAGDQQSLIVALRTGWGIRARYEPSGDVTLYRHSPSR
jgi:transmembrane sensor